MSKFEASNVEPLEYDLSGYKPDPDEPGLEMEERDRRIKVGQLPGWTGIIPEPDDARISKFFYGILPDVRLEQTEAIDALIERQREARLEWWRTQDHPLGTPEPTKDEILNLDVPASRERLEQEQYTAELTASRERGRDRTVAGLAEFCQQHPDAEILAELKWRPFQHFLGWVTGQFRPEALAAAMNS